jgi:3-hydroxyisobutyrate dehydrogenase-like beta-hydroxyacid dehydrogenase
LSCGDTRRYTDGENAVHAAKKSEPSEKEKTMNTLPTVGLISPGDMGHAVGATLRRHGLRVITNLQGRSPRTASLAAKAGIIDVADDQTLVQEADIILSILVPAQAYAFAERIATAVQATKTQLLFVDCNAIAPSTVQAIEKRITATGANFVDAGIIGGPPQEGKAGPRIYASGELAEQLAIFNAYGLDIRIVGPEIGQASGLKMCYAAVTKGLSALATQALTAGKALGLSEALASEFQDSISGLYSTFQRQIPGMPPKAYRWIGEMEEIAHTFGDLGLSPKMLEGAAATYRLVEQTELGKETPEERHRGTTLEDVTDILAAALKKNDAVE